VEGKSLDDLKDEAMNLASKAQEEAKKKTEDVETYGMSKIENAKKTAQEMADMVTKTTMDATKKTSSLANRGIEMVQNLPKNAVRRTSDLANKSLEIAQDATKATAERVKQSPLASRGLEMLQSNVKIAMEKSKPYLPENVKDFVEKNIENKSLPELTNDVISSTRKNLLSAEKEEMPDMKGLALEVTDAVTSGKLVKNVLDLSEKAVSSQFGELKNPPNTSNLRRVFNISIKVAEGIRLFTMDKVSNLTFRYRAMLLKNMNSFRARIDPFLNQYGTPVMRSLGNLGVPFTARFQSFSKPEEQPESKKAVTTKSETKGLVQGKGMSAAPESSSSGARTAELDGTAASGLGGATVAVGAGTGQNVTISEHVESTIPPTDEATGSKKSKKSIKG